MELKTPEGASPARYFQSRVSIPHASTAITPFDSTCIHLLIHCRYISASKWTTVTPERTPRTLPFRKKQRHHSSTYAYRCQSSHSWRKVYLGCWSGACGPLARACVQGAPGATCWRDQTTQPTRQPDLEKRFHLVMPAVVLVMLVMSIVWVCT